MLAATTFVAHPHSAPVTPPTPRGGTRDGETPTAELPTAARILFSTLAASHGVGRCRLWQRSRGRRQASANEAVQTVASPAAVKIEEWFSTNADVEAGQAQGFLGSDLSKRAKDLLGDASIPAPAKRQEPWRYTDLQTLFKTDDESHKKEASLTGASIAALIEEESSEEEEQASKTWQMTFIDGRLSLEHSRLSEPSDGIFVGGVDALQSAASEDEQSRVTDLLAKLPEVDVFLPESRGSMGSAKLAALNQAAFSDCAAILCPGADSEAEASAASTVQVTFVSTGSTPLTSPRVLVEAGEGSRVNLVETHVSLDSETDSSFSNGLVRVVAGDGSTVSHDILQQKGGKARVVHTVTSEVASRASYALRVVQHGGQVARLNASIGLQGKSAACELSGLCVAEDGQQLDMHTLIHHTVPGCSSNQRQKNVAAGAGECIFKGSICVDKAAQQTESSQICRSLLLSEESEVKAMPSLQIKADDVSCSHGATISELDESELFYLQSRGLSPEDARALLLLAYPQEVVGDLKAKAPRGYQRLMEKMSAIAGAVSSG